MRLGFMTSCLPDAPLEEVAKISERLGYTDLEVASWPTDSSYEFPVTHLDAVDPRPDDTLALLDRHGQRLSAIAFYDNNLHPHPALRERINAHLMTCVDAAVSLGVGVVTTFVGRDPRLSVMDNLKLSKEVFPRLSEYAGQRGVKLAIENCPMEGWHIDGYPGNLAYSPELWEFLFEELDLYLNYDPSHLVWLGIDPVAVIEPYVDRIPHWQAKDIEVSPEARNRYGHFGKTVSRVNGWDVGWWRYRVPGLGEVDWRRVIDRFYQLGYDGTVSVEHEDPVWGGDQDRAVNGLQIAERTLSGHLVTTR